MADDQALQGQPSHLANGSRGRSQVLPDQPHGFTFTHWAQRARFFSEGVKWGDGMGGGRSGRFGGAPVLGQHPGKYSIFQKKQNRGAPKTAVPTTTHPIPNLTPSYFHLSYQHNRVQSDARYGFGNLPVLNGVFSRIAISIPNIHRAGGNQILQNNAAKHRMPSA